jgi:hypothetical protein
MNLYSDLIDKAKYNVRSYGHGAFGEPEAYTDTYVNSDKLIELTYQEVLDILNEQIAQIPLDEITSVRRGVLHSIRGEILERLELK